MFEHLTEEERKNLLVLLKDTVEMFEAGKETSDGALTAIFCGLDSYAKYKNWGYSH